jgi:hypothetical protein
MRKFTLLALALLTGSSALLAQSPATRIDREPDHRLTVDLERETILHGGTQVTGTISTSTSAGTRDISYSELGTAGNGLTVLNNMANVIAANSALKTLAFVHRNDPSVFPGTFSGQYRMDVSKDGGNTWTNNSELINPNCIPANGYNGRYPQAVFYNPSGSSTADSLYMVYVGTWHDGTATVNSWDGTSSGVARIDGNTSTFTETNVVVNNENVGIFTALCESTPGTFWTVSHEYDEDDSDANYNDSNYVVLKGVWNASTRDVDWSISAKITLTPDLNFDGTTYDINPVIAFDPSGQKGWIALSGDFIDEGLFVYQPVLISTIDGGNTWSEPTYLDLSQFDEVVTTLSPDGTGVPSTAFDAGLAVDVNGNPHYVIVVGSGSDNGIQGFTHHIFDFVRFGDTWVALDLADLGLCLRGYVGSGGGGVTYTQDNRVRISRTPDGTKMYVTWIATDSTLFDTDYTNSYPNLFGIGVNSQLQTTEIKNFTAGSDFDAAVYMPQTAPICLRTDADDASIVPTVVLKVAGDGSFESPTEFFYLNGVQFDDSEFPVGVETVAASAFEVSQNSPNPFSNYTQFVITLEKAADVTFRATNVLGQEILNEQTTYASGKHVYTFDRANLPAGQYYFTVTADGYSVTKKIVID